MAKIGCVNAQNSERVSPNPSNTTCISHYNFPSLSYLSLYGPLLDSGLDGGGVNYRPESNERREGEGLTIKARNRTPSASDAGEKEREGDCENKRSLSLSLSLPNGSSHQELS